MTSLPTTLSRDAAAALDRADPLARCRDRFHLPEGVLYFDGNSLGPLPRTTPNRIRQVTEQEWGEGLVRSWTERGWMGLPLAVGDRIASLVGAGPGEVVVADSTSVNLFKLAVAALELRPGRPVLLAESHAFPTDLYLAEAATRHAGGERQLRTVPREDLLAALDDQVAVACLAHVDFRTGHLLDLAEATAAVHRAGALALWDLSHSAGALPVGLAAAEADLAVGCGYKFLNGGPGAPAFLYLSRRLQESAANPLPGWLGHRRPFAFAPTYQPAAGVARFRCGTPPVLSLAALDAGLDAFEGVALEALRDKSVALGELFLRLVETRCPGLGLTPGCPRDSRRRGSQVVFRHSAAYPVSRALASRGVIGDFRDPDRLRFGLAPLYLRFTDVWDAVEVLRQVLADGSWDRPEHHRRLPVT